MSSSYRRREIRRLHTGDERVQEINTRDEGGIRRILVLVLM
jgi:phage-related protein